MLTPYSLIKTTHVTLVILSVSLFFARGLGTAGRAHWPMRPAVRKTSVLIDTALLLAGATLWWMLGLNPLTTPWLFFKMAALPVYVVLGSLALKSTGPRPLKLVWLTLALVTVGHMAAAALAHRPFGYASA